MTPSVLKVFKELKVFALENFTRQDDGSFQVEDLQKEAEKAFAAFLRARRLPDGFFIPRFRLDPASFSVIPGIEYGPTFQADLDLDALPDPWDADPLDPETW